MPRSTRITFSLPLDMAERVDQIAQQQRRSKSDLLRAAVVSYVGEYEWRELLRYGERTAGEKGFGPEDVAALVEEYRAEVGSSGA